jgi:hypothetical protein
MLFNAEDFDVGHPTTLILDRHNSLEQEKLLLNLARTLLVKRYLLGRE